MLTYEEFRAALLARHGHTVQERLERGSIAICGLGGLGSNIAISLARIGVGHLHLIDFDCVEMSNLNRQQYLLRHLGLPKTEALRDLLGEINPWLRITADTMRITEENLSELVKEEAIVCEAFDDAAAKAMLVNGVLEQFPEKIIVAATGMAGYDSGNSIRTRRITDRFYLCGDEVSAPRPEHGLMAPRVAICANHQANTIARLLIGETEA